MKFDFDKIIERRNTNSLKWNVKENELPMWVADMDFQTAPAIIDILKKRVEFGIFGYSEIPEQWYDAIISWWNKRHNFKIEKEWMTFCTGVVASISCAIKRITNCGDKILIQTPVYNIFFNSVINHGRRVLENELIYDNEKYSIDFDDLENKLSDPLTTMMILCNPQNPGGRIWTRDELYKIGELCDKYGVTVLSDEIHCDLTDPCCEYIPFANVSDICRNISITCISPSKTFNIAGLHSAAILVPNGTIRNNIVIGLNSDEIAEPNSFAIDGVIAAYTKGDEWLDELRKYIYENKSIVNEFIKIEIPDIKVVKSEATYLVWLDCSKITSNTSEMCQYIRQKTGLYISKGAVYGSTGSKFIRMNIACSKLLLIDGLNRLKSGVKLYENFVSENIII